MADFYEPMPEQLAKWEQWKQERPQVVADLAERFPPWKLFRMQSTGVRCHVLSYAENGTMTVAVTGRFNRVLFSRQVFGIVPEELEECELPLPDEDVGDTAKEAGYTNLDVCEILIPKLRENGFFSGSHGAEGEHD